MGREIDWASDPDLARETREYLANAPASLENVIVSYSALTDRVREREGIVEEDSPEIERLEAQIALRLKNLMDNLRTNYSRGNLSSYVPLGEVPGEVTADRLFFDTEAGEVIRAPLRRARIIGPTVDYQAKETYQGSWFSQTDKVRQLADVLAFRSMGGKRGSMDYNALKFSSRQEGNFA